MCTIRPASFTTRLGNLFVGITATRSSSDPPVGRWLRVSKQAITQWSIVARPPKGESANQARRPPTRRYPNQSPGAPGARVAGPDASRYVDFRAALSSLPPFPLVVLATRSESQAALAKEVPFSGARARGSKPTRSTAHTHTHTHMPPLSFRQAPGFCRTYGTLPIYVRWMRIYTQPGPARP